MNDQAVKKRVSYEMILDLRIQEVERLGLNDLNEYRNKCIQWMSSTETLMKEDNITDGRKQYLLGLKNHVIAPLLNHIKKRRATMHRVVHNGASRDFASRFIEKAMEILSIEQFQSVYGAALTKVEIESQSIEDVRQFMQDSVKRTQQNQ